MNEDVTSYVAGLPAGVYTLCVTGNDSSGNSTEECILLAVYDPSAGFVTGGGWINSPLGALASDTSSQGKATFGFVSKYVKTKTNLAELQGNTQFTYQAGDIAFQSTSYEWLVVNQGDTNAQFKGMGTINGAGNYGFMLWASDGEKSGAPDSFRIQIWNKDAGDAVVYDSGAQVIVGGSIIVHTPKK